ncbi:MAG: GNAT family N-acetyltransferase [Ktedonobacterales bacterium]
MTLATPGLRICEAEADDLPALLPTYLSNPDYVALNEGSRGESGYFDLAMLQRDWWVARMMPGRHMLGIYLASSDIAAGEPGHAAVGMMDFATEGPSAGLPWLGSLVIVRSRQRQGLGSEALAALVAHLAAATDAPAVRCGVRVENAAGLAFCRARGFASVDTLTSDGHRFSVLERTLLPRPSEESNGGRV